MKVKVIRLIITLIFLLIAIMVLTLVFEYARAEDYYVLCKPAGEVNIREKPKLKSEIVATAFFADKLTSDGKKQNGFIHITGLNAETDSGWIYGGLLVEDKPVASSGSAQVFKAEKVACRKYADRNSKVLKRLDAGENVLVFAISEKWCVTEYGYIMTEFLTLNARVKP